MTEQLSGMDAAFLSMETPESPMHVVGVLLLDPAGGKDFTVEGLHQVIADRIHLMPPFCRRLIEAPLSLDKPYWHYDTDVDLDQHVFDVRLAEGSDLHALGELVGGIAEQRLPRDRPLWELHVVTGLADDRVAIVAKVHHSTLYGAAGAEFIAELLDLSPEIAEKPGPEAGDAVVEPSRAALARRTVTSTARLPLVAGGLVVKAGRNAGSAARNLGDVVRRHGRDALPALAPRLPISGSPTQRRTTAFTGLPLDEVKAVKDAAGVTVNDAVLATVTLAMRRYLNKRDLPIDKGVVAGVPMNVGDGATSGTDSLATLMVSLPTYLDDPAELLPAVHAATLAAKDFTAALGPSAISELAEVTVPAAMSAVTWLTRSLGLATLQPTLANLIVSNVMGPPIPLYLAGARVDAIFPMGPLLTGAGMNITVLSNEDRLDVGIMACPDLVDDAWELADSLADCLAVLHG